MSSSVVRASPLDPDGDEESPRNQVEMTDVVDGKWSGKEAVGDDCKDGVRCNERGKELVARLGEMQMVGLDGIANGLIGGREMLGGDGAVEG